MRASWQQFRRVAFAAYLAISLVGCQEPPNDPRTAPTTAASPSATPVVTPTPSPTPGTSQDDFAELTSQYEASLEESENGFSLLKDILAGTMPEGLPPLEELKLDSEEEQKAFDQHLLPILTAAFSRPNFVPNQKLVAGDAGVDFRALRSLVHLLCQRADQEWTAGNTKRALEHLELPFRLSAAMQKRPETASVNLFSSAYVEPALRQISQWVQSPQFDQDSLQSLQDILSQNTPRYEHLAETVSVDFAQLLNSLESSEGREILGLGEVEDSTLETWRSQLHSLHLAATGLYTMDKSQAAAFNQEIRQASGPLQGIVIDYPEVATMQKYSFCKYKGLELGLRLLGASESEPTDYQSLIAELAQGDEKEAAILNTLLAVERKDGLTRVAGAPGTFELLAPGVKPVFFEHQKSQAP